MANDAPKRPAYVGRFAPSPTGPLHFGSLIAALGSFLDARQHQGRWLVRIEDLDPPRTVSGAADAILSTLEHFGLLWDGEVLYQSNRGEAYRAALDVLLAKGLVYACDCSRKDISLANPDRPDVYIGTCRNKALAFPQRALRMTVGEGPLRFEDRVRGRYEQVLDCEVGDFVIRRADGLFAYQLAVVVDDAAQGVTDVVRGSDLLDSTPRQIHLQQHLELPQPRYLHLPLAINGAGEKLSKQTFARPLDPKRTVPLLWKALRFLGQRPPEELMLDERDVLLRWAIENWDIEKIPLCHAHLEEPITDD